MKNNYNYVYDDRISITGLIIKIALIIGFVLLLMWIFPMPNISNQIKDGLSKFDPLLDRVFAENIDSMREAGRSYFTVERMPKDENDTKRLTLKTLFDKNMVIPFVDKNGNECDTENSYVEVSKDNNEYLMKVNLVCGDDENHVIEYIGCYDFCETCEDTSQVAYLFQKVTPKTYTNTYCPSGTVNTNGTCLKTVNSGSYVDASKAYTKEVKTYVNATPIYTDQKTQTLPARAVYTQATTNIVPATLVQGSSTVTKSNLSQRSVTKEISYPLSQRSVTKEVTHSLSTSTPLTRTSTVSATANTTRVANGTTWGAAQTIKRYTSLYAYENSTERLYNVYKTKEQTCSTCVTTRDVWYGTYQQKITNYTNKTTYTCPKNTTTTTYTNNNNGTCTARTKGTTTYYCQVGTRVGNSCIEYQTTTESYCAIGTKVGNSCIQYQTTTESYCAVGTRVGNECHQTVPGKDSYDCGNNTNNYDGTCTVNIPAKFSHMVCDKGTPAGDPYKLNGLTCSITTGNTFSHYDCSKTNGKLVDADKGLCEIVKPAQFSHYYCDKGTLANDKCYIGKTENVAVKAVTTSYQKNSIEYKWSTSSTMDGWTLVRKGTLTNGQYK